MPQLIPFFFVNQFSFAIFGLFVLVFFFSRYILPGFLQLFLTRLYITKI